MSLDPVAGCIRTPMSASFLASAKARTADGGIGSGERVGPAVVDPRGLVDARAHEDIDPESAAFASQLSDPKRSLNLDFAALTTVSLKKAGLSLVPDAIGRCVHVTKLELSLNPGLSSLPDAVGALQSLRILFALGCSFTSVPPILATLSSLYMLSFKSNQLSHISDKALAPSLQWLILTDNKLERLPSTLPLGLRKVMLTNNKLVELPSSILKCRDLELIRLADNRLSALPEGMLAMPKLSWMGLAGNPILTATAAASAPRWVGPDELIVHEVLGAGGGGFVHRATWRDRPGDADVALKIFRNAGSVTDGDPSHEIDLGAVLQVGKLPRNLNQSLPLSISLLSSLSPLTSLDTRRARAARECDTRAWGVACTASRSRS